MIDPKLVDDLNDVGNDDVKLFYRDAYLHFRREELKSLNETVHSILQLYGQKNIELKLREEYAIYDYLVRKFGQREAANAWQMLKEKMKEIESTVNVQNGQTLASSNTTQLTQEQSATMGQIDQSARKRFVPIPDLIELASTVKKSSNSGFIENDYVHDVPQATSARKRNVRKG